MFKGTPELIAQRREEIINACEQLYQTMNFKDITLKEIGAVTSFTRTSIGSNETGRCRFCLSVYTGDYICMSYQVAGRIEKNTMKEIKTENRKAVIIC